MVSWSVHRQPGQDGFRVVGDGPEHDGYKEDERDQKRAPDPGSDAGD
jgi:hypothetical protein